MIPGGNGNLRYLFTPCLKRNYNTYNFIRNLFSKRRIDTTVLGVTHEIKKAPFVCIFINIFLCKEWISPVKYKVDRHILTHNFKLHTWRRHHMETFSASLALCEGNTSPHTGQWRWTLTFCLICAWTNGWANNRDVGDLRRLRPHYDVTVMQALKPFIRMKN